MIDDYKLQMYVDDELDLDEKTDMVLGITKANRSPWFNMVQKNDSGFLDVLMKNGNFYTSRQETPTVFDMTTVAYVSRPEYIKESTGIFDGKVKGVEIPVERALDIDTELDFEIAAFLIKEVTKFKEEIPKIQSYYYQLFGHKLI